MWFSNAEVVARAQEIEQLTGRQDVAGGLLSVFFPFLVCDRSAKYARVDNVLSRSRIVSPDHRVVNLFSLVIMTLGYSQSFAALVHERRDGSN